MPKVVIPVPATEPDLATVPRRVDRATGAALVTQYYFPTSPRALETWGLEWTVVAGKAIIETATIFAAAQAKLDAGRPARSYRPATARQSAPGTDQQQQSAA